MERFQVTCRSTSPGRIPAARFPLTGVPVEQDSRFVVSRPRPEEMIIIAPHGLPSQNGAVLIECFFLNAGTRSALVLVNATASDISCSKGFRCGDGSCIPPWQQCDGQLKCVDGLDEPPLVCLADLEGSAAVTTAAWKRQEGAMVDSTVQTAPTKPIAKVWNYLVLSKIIVAVDVVWVKLGEEKKLNLLNCCRYSPSKGCYTCNYS
ncbi:hypothetical protein TSMEX_011459 [Taenia solium]|eukprot:TsM_001131400 transcript=TsM_001131400 gene=TsM_001131400